MPYVVYLLLCKDKTIYTGITTDVRRRFVEHKAGKASHYTSARGAEKILYTEHHKTRSDALKREAQIKGWTRKKKLTLVTIKPVLSGIEGKLTLIK